MTSNPNRDIELFAEAIQLSPAERIAFLDRACADDADLRRRIEALLRSNDRVGAFLEEPPTGSITEERPKSLPGKNLETASAGTNYYSKSEKADVGLFSWLSRKSWCVGGLS